MASDEKRDSMKYFYPAIFTCHEEEGKYTIEFPDLIGCTATASTMETVVRKAREALGMSLWELEEKAIPAPLPSKEIGLRHENRNAHICMMVVDMDEYRAYRLYKVQQAEQDAIRWAMSKKKQHASLWSRVFGLR